MQVKYVGNRMQLYFWGEMFGLGRVGNIGNLEGMYVVGKLVRFVIKGFIK